MTQGHGIEREGLLSRIILIAGYKRDARGPCLSQEEQECMSEEWPGPEATMASLSGPKIGG